MFPYPALRRGMRTASCLRLLPVRLNQLAHLGTCERDVRRCTPCSARYDCPPRPLRHHNQGNRPKKQILYHDTPVEL